MTTINTDSIPKEDLLNRKEFANQIAGSIKLSFKNAEESFVLGINGKWGSGKTTLMKYLEDSLRDQSDSKSVFFNFNPWMFSGKEDLLSLFLNQLAKNLDIKDLKKKLTQFADALSYFDWIKYVHAGAGHLQESAKNSLKNVDSKKSIQKLKENIDNVIVKNQLRIFVFIDDLDRLTPKEVVEIFQIVKLNASFRNTVFIISYDKEVVQDILTVHHGFDGEKYLEKIIQVDYRIPDILEEVIEQIFFNNLKQLFEDIDVAYDEDTFKAHWIVRRLKFYFVTLRDIHRYFNALKLRLPSIKNNIDIDHFCLIEAVRIFDYPAYEVTQKNYKKSIMFGPQTRAGRFIEQLDNENTQVIINDLLNKGSSNHKFPIWEPKFFDRYFALSIAKKDIKEEIVDMFIQDKESRYYIVETSTLDGSVQSLLESLTKKTPDLGAINPLIRWKPQTERNFIDCRHQFIETLGHIIESCGDFAHGTDFLISILPGDDGHFNPAKLYLLSYLNNGITNDSGSIFHRHIDSFQNHIGELEKMEKEFLKRYETDNIVFSNTYPFKTPFFHKLFLMEYCRLFPDEYIKKLKLYIEKQENYFLFLSYILQPENPNGHQIDEPSLSKLVTTTILDALDLESSKYSVKGLTKLNKSLLECYRLHQGVLKQAIKSTEYDKS